MYRTICLLLLIASVSAALTVKEKRDLLQLINVDDIVDGATYEYDVYYGGVTIAETVNCTKPGTVCGDCFKVYECIPIGDGFLVIALPDCKTGETCQMSTGTCVTTHNPGCDDPSEYRFTCYQLGVFPDPFDCQKYHMCYPGVGNAILAKELTCEGEYYYDVKTNLCRKKLVNGDCPVPIPSCKEVGSRGAVNGNPSLYYICFKAENSGVIFPHIFVCENVKEYDIVSKQCVDLSPKLGLGSDGKCLATGTFYDPTNCNAFRTCSGVAALPMNGTCSVKMYYDYKTNKCNDFTCNMLN